MQWLTALLAFAVTMLIFAIIVSTFVELIHRFFNLRAKGMQLMLENLYENVVFPYLTEKPQPTGSVPPKTEFALRIMQNRASGDVIDQLQQGVALAAGAPKAFGAKISTMASTAITFFRDAFDFKLMTEVPVEIFTQKLADPKIVPSSNNLGEAVLKDIAQKYVAYGDEIGTYFERRARLLSVIVALIVAWVFFVQPYKLISHYVRSPEVAEKVADLASDVSQQYNDQVDRLKASVEELDPDPAKSKAQIDEAVAEFKAAMQSANEDVADLQGLGAAVGWPDRDKVIPCVDRLDPQKLDAYASQFRSGEKIEGFCTAKLAWMDNAVFPGYGETFWLLIGGLLVGLGAPFWAQAVSSLSATRDLTRKVTDIVNPARPAGSGGVTRGLGGAGASTEYSTFDLARGAAARDEEDRQRALEQQELETLQRAARRAERDQLREQQKSLKGKGIQPANPAKGLKP